MRLHGALPLDVSRRIRDAGILEAFAPNTAGITLATGQAGLVRLITGDCLGKVDAEFEPHLDDLRLAKIDKWGVNAKPFTFDACPRREVSHRFVRLQIFRPAIRVTRIVHRIRANEYIATVEHFRPRERE